MKRPARPALARRCPFLVLAAGAVVVGCAGPGDEGDTARPAASGDDVAAMDTAADAAADSPTAGSATGSTGDTVPDPFAGFQLDAPPGASADTSRIALLLRNEATVPAIVWADGGAGEVLLDSVPAGAAVRVDVMTRARTIFLRSAAPDGGDLRRTEVDAGMDTVVEVIVGRSADAM